MGKKMICDACFSTKGFKTHTPGWGWGLFLVSCVLLVVFFPAAFVCFIIAACVGEKRCKTCKHQTSGVPVKSPRGRQMVAEAKGAFQQQAA